MWLLLSGDMPIAALDATNKYSTLIHSLCARNTEQTNSGRQSGAFARTFACAAEPAMKKPKLTVTPVVEGFALGAFDDCASSVWKLLNELDAVTAAKFMVCVCVHA